MIQVQYRTGFDDDNKTIENWILMYQISLILKGIQRQKKKLVESN
jgi:hypothetical protein